MRVSALASLSSSKASSGLDETVAKFVTVVPTSSQLSAITVTVMVRRSPAASAEVELSSRVALSSSTVPFSSKEWKTHSRPTDGSEVGGGTADTKVRPAGRMSVTATVVAPTLPLLP